VYIESITIVTIHIITINMLCELSCTGFNNRCEFNKNLTNKTNINYERFTVRLTQEKRFLIDIVNFFKKNESIIRYENHLV
jgi:hypothetical protein